MPAPKFDSTIIKQNKPEVTFATPEAMPTKYNSLTGIIKNTNTLVKAAVDFDKKLTLSEAEREAELLSDDYQSGSITGQSILEQKQTALLNKIAGDGTEEERQAWEIELEAVTNKHKAAKVQGLMSPYEMQSRMQAAAADLIERNPAYADEIIKKMSSVFDRSNLNTLIDADIKYIEDQETARKEEFKAKTDYLTEKKVFWERYGNIDNPKQIEILYAQERIRDENSEAASRLAAKGVQLNEEQKEDFLATVNIDYPSTGIYGAVENDIKLLSLGLEHIQEGIGNDESGKSYKSYTTQEKNQAREKVILEAYSKLDFFLANIPARSQAEKDNIKRLRESSRKNIEYIGQEFEKNVGTPKVALQNLKDSMLLEMHIDAYKEGYNPVFEKRLEVRLRAYEVFKGSTALFAAAYDAADIKNMSDGLIDFIATGGAKSKSVKSKNVFEKIDMVGSIKEFSDLALDELNNEGTIAIPTLGLINNVFVKAESLTGNERLDEEDRLLSLLTTQVDNKVFNTLMQNSDFSTSIMEHLQFYKEALTSTIPFGTEVTITNGLFYSPNDSRINKNLIRLNNYVLLKAKIDGVKPSQIAEQILSEDFPIFNIKDKESKVPVEKKVSPSFEIISIED